MRGLPDGGVVHVQIAVDGAHHHLARIQPDADLHVDALGAAELVRVPAHRLLHAERGVTGAHGVILVGHRRAEEGHDAVAHDLVHRALVAMNGLHHAFEDGIEDLAGLLRITVGEELHRSLHVGEEHGDELPLALERALRGEDLVGEVLGCVGLRVGEAVAWTGPGARHRRPACSAESGGRGYLHAAGGAGASEFRTTLLAEARSFAAPSLAAWTGHGVTSRGIGTSALLTGCGECRPPQGARSSCGGAGRGPGAMLAASWDRPASAPGDASSGPSCSRPAPLLLSSMCSRARRPHGKPGRARSTGWSSPSWWAATCSSRATAASGPSSKGSASGPISR